MFCLSESTSSVAPTRSSWVISPQLTCFEMLENNVFQIKKGWWDVSTGKDPCRHACSLSLIPRQSTNSLKLSWFPHICHSMHHPDTQDKYIFKNVMLAPTPRADVTRKSINHKTKATIVSMGECIPTSRNSIPDLVVLFLEVLQRREFF